MLAILHQKALEPALIEMPLTRVAAMLTPTRDCVVQTHPMNRDKSAP